MTDTMDMRKKNSGGGIATLILKGGSTTSATDRDAGFCSGEDDLEIEDDIHSPTDASEDSVEVKVTPISFRNKNKRKCAEPRKVPNDEVIPSGPLKKRIRFEMKQDASSNGSPFRPWSVPNRVNSAEESSAQNKNFHPVYGYQSPSSVQQETSLILQIPSPSKNFHPVYGYQSPTASSPTPKSFQPICGYQSSSSINQLDQIQASNSSSKSSSSPPPKTYQHPAYRHLQSSTVVQQEEPLSLVKTKDESTRHRITEDPDANSQSTSDALIIRPKEFAKLPIKVEPPPRVPSHPGVHPASISEMEELTRPPKSSPDFTVESLLAAKAGSSKDSDHRKDQKEQRNYKNMTRERRIEANARERTRVHTISAAFDTLRKSIPAYSHNQKLSKLSVLRIACSYILTLSRVAGEDYSADQSEPSLASCVDLVSRTIQTEGKLRKKKDE